MERRFRVTGWLSGIVVLLLITQSPAHGAVAFKLQFEQGSKWYTETYSEQARANMQGMLDELGNFFSATAEIIITVDDNETVAYARSGPSWGSFISVAGRAGQFYANSLWMQVNRAASRPSSSTSDANISWNLDLDGLYGGDTNRLLKNIRGLVRHEILHPLGMLSYFSQQDGVSDPRGKYQYATTYDGLLSDQKNDPLLLGYDSGKRQFLVNSYSLSNAWTSTKASSGLYFTGIDKEGGPVKMPLYSSPGNIDFSHVYAVSYTDAHVPWGEWLDQDFNFLRGLGYQLIGDVPPTGLSLEVVGRYAPFFRMHLKGPIGSSVVIQRSSDLAAWTSWQSLTLLSPLTILDDSSSGPAPGTNRFYRLMQ